MRLTTSKLSKIKNQNKSLFCKLNLAHWRAIKRSLKECMKMAFEVWIFKFGLQNQFFILFFEWLFPKKKLNLIKKSNKKLNKKSNKKIK